MSVLVLGASGLLGNAVFRVLSEIGDTPIYGAIRNKSARSFFIPEISSQLLIAENLLDPEQLITLMKSVKPKVVVNCMALPKTAPRDSEQLFSVFSLFPRRLAHLCRLYDIRLIQISSDGVFSGKRGGYSENDLPDATDPYGLSKFLGEVEGEGLITLRTSIIGHELSSKSGLLEWFLSQGENCNAYTKAIFSGFPSVVLAQIIRDEILPRSDLHGIYHLASEPISKYELLCLVAQRYGRPTRVIPDDKVVVNRSLVADRFTHATGYVPPKWPELINTMFSYKYGLKEN